MALFQVVVGTYEKVLYGWVVKKRGKVSTVPQKHLDSDDEIIDALRDDSSPLVLERSFAEMPHTGCIKTVHTTGRWLVSGATDESLKIYDLRKMREVGTLMHHENGITCARLVGDTHLLSGDEDGKICVWRSKDWEVLKTLKGHQLGINSISVHPSGKLALSVARDRTMHLWNLLNGRSAFKSQLKYEAEIVQWSPSGDTYTLVAFSSIRIFSAKGELLEHIEAEDYKHILALVYLSDELIAYGGEDQKITIYSLKSKKTIAELKGFENRVKALAVVPKVGKETGKYPYIVSISSDYRLCVWDMDHSTTLPAAETIVNARPVCLTASPMPEPAPKKPENELRKRTDDDEDEEESDENPKKKSQNVGQQPKGQKRKLEEVENVMESPKAKKAKGETPAKKVENNAIKSDVKKGNQNPDGKGKGQEQVKAKENKKAQGKKQPEPESESDSDEDQMPVSSEDFSSDSDGEFGDGFFDYDDDSGSDDDDDVDGGDGEDFSDDSDDEDDLDGSEDEDEESEEPAPPPKKPLKGILKKPEELPKKKAEEPPKKPLKGILKKPQEQPKQPVKGILKKPHDQKPQDNKPLKGILKKK